MEINKVILPSPNNSEIDPTVTGLYCLFCGTKFISAGGEGVAGHNPCEHVMFVYSPIDNRYEYTNSRFLEIVDDINNELSEDGLFPMESWTKLINENTKFAIDSMMFVEFAQMDGYVNGPIITVGFDLAYPEAGDES